MEKRCEYCGKALSNGKVCECRFPNSTTESDYFKISISKESIKKTQEKIAAAQKKLNENISSNTNNMPTKTYSESNGSNDTVHAVDGAFERDLQIVDTCIVPTEREIPIRQYKIAEMRTPFLKKAFGRLQVTNKRVVFRSAGRSLLGPIITEKEFAIEELSGIDIKSDYNFSLLVLFFSIIENLFLTILFIVLSLTLSSISDGDYSNTVFVFAVIYILTSIAVYILSHKSKIVVASLLNSAGLLFIFSNLRIFNIFLSDDSLLKNNLLLGILLIIGANIMTFLSGIVDDLQIIIKIKGAHDAINISKSTLKQDCSGFMIIKPWEDTNLAIQELGALITDIKQQGDNAINKWKV